MSANRASAPIGGTVAPGFEDVRVEFERNLAEREELGAAVAAFHRGRKVVDLWGGYADVAGRRAWAEDTLVLVFSVTKGLTAMATAVAHSKSLLDFDERVATYWPEFAQNGKAEITVRQVLSHRSGLSTVDERLTAQNMGDREFLADALARQRPLWQPGTAQGYHYLTIGWLSAELIRRVDPGHRTLGRFFADEIAEPLGLEVHIRLPPDIPASRVAAIEASSGIQMLTGPATIPPTMPPEMLAAYLRPGSIAARTLSNPRITGPGQLDEPKFRCIEIPAGGGFAQVRDIAKAFSEFAAGATTLGLRPQTLAELEAPGRLPPGQTNDLVWNAGIYFSLGFIKPSPEFEFGSSERAYGSQGAGGAFAFADSEAKLAYAYAPNRMGTHLVDDPREKALRDALSRCLAAMT